MAIRNGIFKVRNTSTGEKDEVMLKTTVEQVEGLDKMTGFNPTGTIIAFAGNTLPDGYLLCDGSQVSRTTYKKLFDVIGVTYGEGDGSTTFTLPNLIDRFLEGSSAAGNYVAAGLPNIEGAMLFRGFKSGANDIGKADSNLITNNAFQSEVNTSSATYYDGVANFTWGSTRKTTNFSFNASRASAIYGNANTVQPTALLAQYLIKY